jgi:hypothetical protein
MRLLKRSPRTKIKICVKYQQVGKNSIHYKTFQEILAKHLPLVRQLPLTKSTKTELQRIDTPVPLPEPACRCHLKRTDDRQTAIETCKGSS